MGEIQEIEKAIELLEERYMTVSMCLSVEYCKAQNKALDLAISALKAQIKHENTRFRTDYVNMSKEELEWLCIIKDEKNEIKDKEMEGWKERVLKKQSKDNWVSLNDRLPTKEEYNKNDGRFIVTDGNRVYQSLFDFYEKHFVNVIYKENCNFSITKDERIIAWQSLPFYTTEKKWISVINNSPKTEGNYLVMYDDGTVGKHKYLIFPLGEGWIATGKYFNIIAWQPLLEKHEEEEM